MLSKLNELGVDSLALVKKQTEALNQNRAIRLGTKYIEEPSELGYKYTVVVEHDRKYSPRGWQFRRFGNSVKGHAMFQDLKKGCTILDDLGKSANRNDSDPRYYEHLILQDENNNIVEVITNPSRSGNSCAYSFFVVEAVTEES